MHTWLTNFLQVNKLFFSHQFGFRNGCSSNHALTSLTEMIRKAIDEGKFACGVFIDLQKAFDTADHGILLSKLNYYGLGETPINGLKLSDRQVIVYSNFPTKVRPS